ncbi:scavenger receptor cysteine-rich domain superfamily protein-like [Lytechinus variegatus]|uniref:scavenger receptor cysteine-rich domain superfamily protein-like n=1 Tax=Lytechinus variegatus TaxID=7654 RepID=UPI001BB1BFB2|nr:scavenger receptor cysteine-rich domain superfamily protein-like [Lytechinus variegatus]
MIFLSEFSVELIGNATYQSSRVSVFHDGQWKSVCSDNWDWRTAQVACRQAGYFGTSYHLDQDAFSDFHPMVFTGHDIACDGSEYHLYYCSADWDSPTCTSNKVASVTCADSYEDLLQDGDLRMTNGTSSKDGQIEMFNEGFWRPVCGDEWGWEEATVACRQLGYLGAISAYTAISYDDETEFIWSGLDCEGGEYRLQECYIPSIGRELTSHCQYIGGAHCALSQSLIHENGAVQFISDGGANSGAIAVFYRGVWGKICPDDWIWSLANMACFQLGYYGAIESTSAVPDTDDGIAFHMHSLQCDEFEGYITSCDLEHSWEEDEVECNSDDGLAAGVVCTHQYQDVPYDGKSRLVDGPDVGHVEVFFDDSWGLVCGESWSYDNARVVCINLGYRGVLDASSIQRSDSLSREVVLSDVDCNGWEFLLTDCYSSFLDISHCQSLAYTECTMASDEINMQEELEIRLSDGEVPHEGRVEVFILGRWASICSDYWSDNEAEVVCTQLGYTDGVYTAVYGGYYGSSPNGQIKGYPICNGWESTLNDCYLFPAYGGQCYNSDVGVNCDSDDPERMFTIIIVVAVVVVVLAICSISCIGYWCCCKKTAATVPVGAVHAMVEIPQSLPPVMTNTVPTELPSLQYSTLPPMEDIALPPGQAPKPPPVVYVPPPSH